MLDTREKKNITVDSTVRIETSKDAKKSNIVFGKIKKVLDDEEYREDGYRVVLDDDSSGVVCDIIKFVQSNIDPDLELILSGESDIVEFKQSFSFDVHRFESTGEKVRLDKNEFNIPKAICGFANSSGGTLYIGIADRTGDPVGLEDDYQVLDTDADGFQNHIKMIIRKFFGDNKAIAKNIKPKMLKIKGKDIFKIRVSASKTPFIIEEKINGKNFPYFFVRVGNGTEDFSARNFVEYWMNHVGN